MGIVGCAEPIISSRQTPSAVCRCSSNSIAHNYTCSSSSWYANGRKLYASTCSPTWHANASWTSRLPSHASNATTSWNGSSSRCKASNASTTRCQVSTWNATTSWILDATTTWLGSTSPTKDDGTTSNATRSPTKIISIITQEKEINKNKIKLVF